MTAPKQVNYQLVEAAVQEVLHQAVMHGVSDHFHVDIPQGEKENEFVQAVRRELETRLHITNDRYAETNKQAWRYLRNGFFFLGMCLIVGQLVKHLSVAFDDLIGESATVAGWVGMWRPVELFLYDLPELRKERRLYKQLLQSRFFQS